jgi:hypothetical protein
LAAAEAADQAAEAVAASCPLPSTLLPAQIIRLLLVVVVRVSLRKRPRDQQAVKILREQLALILLSAVKLLSLAAAVAVLTLGVAPMVYPEVVVAALVVVAAAHTQAALVAKAARAATVLRAVSRFQLLAAAELARLARQEARAVTGCNRQSLVAQSITLVVAVLRIIKN